MLTDEYDYEPKFNNNRSSKVFYIILGILLVIIAFLVYLSFDKKEKLDSKEKYDIKLIGDSTLNIYVGNEFNDPGCSLISSKRGDISSDIIVSGSVDTTTIGTYNLIYSYNTLEEESYSIMRTVNVLEFPLKLDYKLEPETLTNQNVLINLNVIGDDYEKVVDPEGVIYNDRQFYYMASDNNIYTFSVYTTDETKREVGLKVNNIDRVIPNGSCTSSLNGNDISVKVTSDKEIKKYYLSDGTTQLTESDKNELVTSKFISKAYVKLEDYAGNTNEVTCDTTGIKDFEIFVVNYNSSDCLILRTSTKVMVLDTSKGEAWKRVKGALDGLGIKKIDYLVGSHLHGDHIGNHINVLKNYEVDKIYFNRTPGGDLKKYLDSNNKKYEILRQKDVFYMDNLKIEVFGPKAANQSDENKNSLNLKMTYGNKVFGFFGDGYQENILQDYGAAYLKLDWMKHPHHGISGLDVKFAKIFAPKYDVITCGADILGNKNGAVKSALRSAGASFYYVYSSGDMRFSCDGNSIKVNTKINFSTYKR